MIERMNTTDFDEAKVEVTPVLEEVLESRGLSWSELSFPLRKTLVKRGCNTDMVRFILDHWTVYRRRDSVFFNSYDKNTFVMSNMYPCRMCEGGKTFNSVDHLFHYLRAYAHEAYDCAVKVRRASGVKSGFKSKQIWKQYWKDEGEEGYINETTVKEVEDSAKLLRYCQEVKFDFCDEFRTALRATKHKRLVEYAPWDGLYGVLYNKKDRRYEGVNICGKCMTQLRDERLNSPLILDKLKSVNL